MKNAWKKKFSNMLLSKLLPQQQCPPNISHFRDLIRFAIILKEAEVLNTLGRYQRELDTISHARKIIESYKRKLLPAQKFMLAKMLSWECWAFRIVGEMKRAKASGEQALKILGTIYEIFTDKRRLQETMAAVKNNLAISLYTHGEIDKAIRLWNESKNHYKELGHKKGIGMIYNYFGVVYKERGEYDKAEEMYQKLQKISEEIDDLQGLGIARVNLGATYIEQRRYTEAKNILKKALRAHEQTGNQQGIAIVYSNLGLIFEARAEYVEAEAMYRKNIEISKRIGYKLGVGIASANLGLVHQAQAEFDMAEEGFKRYLDIQEELGNQRGIGIGSMYLGGLYSELNRFKQAASYLKRAEEMLTKLGDWSFLPIFYRKLTYLKLEQLNGRNLKDAEKHLKKIAKIAKDRKSEKFKFLALVLQAGIKAYRDDWKEADKYFEKAVEFFKATDDKRSLAYANSMYGKVSKEKKLKSKAKEHLSKAKTLFKELKLHHKCT